MARSDDMLKLLQAFMRGSEVYKAIFDASGAQLDSRDASVEDFLLQLSVETATWALDVYERGLGIPTDKSKTLADRRSFIIAKMQSGQRVDAGLIKSIVNNWGDTEPDVTFGSSTITITFSNIRGAPTNFEDMKRVIGDTIPAHLKVEYVLVYNTYNAVKDSGATYTNLSQKTYTQIREGSLVFGTTTQKDLSSSSHKTLSSRTYGQIMGGEF